MVSMLDKHPISTALIHCAGSTVSTYFTPATKKPEKNNLSCQCGSQLLRVTQASFMDTMIVSFTHTGVGCICLDPPTFLTIIMVAKAI